MADGSVDASRALFFFFFFLLIPSLSPPHTLTLTLTPTLYLWHPL